ncbi:1,6-anhydro-N-acetylmuramyl-L-alanine amidase AmpD [Chromobacterium alticapitis]|uniref:1,6-anhydro-N-acetylmuramyl-L-alanine amidase AmpD n=1 Tax=Chromobacterium alticapitis TaxID=2073169 RepID=A0A2S5DDY6_9NEIS|nr:1,6-anhydro-N-acetylmuramyl-L-alanine amidase AmpD [Chromobacterium alticapitis]
MQQPFEVRELDLGNVEEARQALRVQLASHQLEVQWLNYPGLPLLWPDLAAVRSCRERIWAAFEGGALRGLVVVSRRPDGGIHIDRTVVDPEHLAQGWGYRLLNRAVQGETSCSVDTAEVNRAALALYHKAGFVQTQRWLTPDGLALWRLEYRPAEPPALELRADGWVKGALQLPSPNCDERSPGCVPELLVIHNISLPPYRYGGAGVEQLFTNRLDPAEHPYYQGIHQLRVSAHFFIRRDGQLLQFVPTGKRAWHAGVSSWRGREKCNDFSIGVEMEGCDFEPFSEAQYRMLAALSAALRKRLPLIAVTGHEHIAPGRKTDPGPFFDWARAQADCQLAN